MEATRTITTTKNGAIAIENYDKDTFEEMVRDWVADRAPEMDDLEIGDPEIDEETGKWVAYAHDDKEAYSLTDDGTGNIVINYLGTR
jgi:hypothetical protein